MRLLIIGDIHAMSSRLKQLSDGYFGKTGGKVFVEERSINKNALLAIEKALLDEEQIDYMICLGDLAHQNVEIVTLAVWNDLNRIANKLKIENLVCVTGNHDVASRPEVFDGRKPNDFLSRLEPKFPINDTDVARDYNQFGVATFRNETFMFMILDTCTLHGYGGDHAHEVFNKGHISEEMLERIEASLSDSDYKTLILVMHHHPKKVDSIEDNDYDEIENGEKLLKILEGTQKPALLIHGHKHFVKISKSGEASHSPLLFSASSLAANAYENMERFFSNQFHIVNLVSEEENTKLKGIIETWDWAGNAWNPSTNPRMPAITGFGRSRTIDEIASCINDIVKSGGSLSGGEALEAVPDLAYSSLSDFDELENKLNTHHGVKAVRSPTGDFSFWKEN